MSTSAPCRWLLGQVAARRIGIGRQLSSRQPVPEPAASRRTLLPTAVYRQARENSSSGSSSAESVSTAPADDGGEETEPLEHRIRRYNTDGTRHEYKRANAEVGNPSSVATTGDWVAEAKVDEGGRHLRVPGHREAFVNLIRLRDRCSCPRCVDPSSGQREFRTFDIPTSIGVREMVRAGDNLVVRWKDDVPGYDSSHESAYSLRDLTELTNMPRDRWMRGGPSRISWNRKVFERNQHWIKYDDYMRDGPMFWAAMRGLFRYGMIFVRDVPEDEQSVERLATRMGPLRNSFYGLTWDVRSKPDAENVAYTNKFLDFHMDLLYMADPPGYQLLHCMRNSLPGGESLFSDARRAVEALRNRDPATHQILSRMPVRYGYHANGQSYEMVRRVVERPSEGHRKGTFTNVNYSPPFQQPMLRSPHVTTEARDKMLHQWLGAMRQLTDELESPDAMFELKLQPGQCVIFENRRVVHARRGFDLADVAQSSSSSSSSSAGDAGETTRDRWLRGAYVDTDAVLSLFDRIRARRNYWWDTTSLADGVFKGKMEAHATTEEVHQWRLTHANFGQT